ncbi:MAG: hypothetical protein FWH06_07295, partial [Oscillospiraceae bacterium]|nr:hypothetical protein [Oscillospiraceae bacterium]
MTWDLPRAAVIGGREYALNTDYRDILEIIALLGAPEPDGGAPDKLYIALCLFYDGWLEHGADANAAEAARFMMEFVGCGMPDETGARPVKLIDWR